MKLKFSSSVALATFQSAQENHVARGDATGQHRFIERFYHHRLFYCVVLVWTDSFWQLKWLPSKRETVTVPQMVENGCFAWRGGTSIRASLHDVREGGLTSGCGCSISAVFGKGYSGQ